jgi:hypothetical protein
MANYTCKTCNGAPSWNLLTNDVCDLCWIHKKIRMAKRRLMDTKQRIHDLEDERAHLISERNK